jgi:hypothetical protein
MGIIHQLHTPLLPLPLAQLCLNQVGLVEVDPKCWALP